jgi:hypothetical protein
MNARGHAADTGLAERPLRDSRRCLGRKALASFRWFELPAEIHGAVRAGRALETDRSHGPSLVAEDDEPDAPRLLATIALECREVDRQPGARLCVARPPGRDACPEHRLGIGIVAGENGADELWRCGDQIEALGRERHRHAPPVTTSVWPLTKSLSGLQKR